MEPKGGSIEGGSWGTHDQHKLVLNNGLVDARRRGKALVDGMFEAAAQLSMSAKPG